MPFVSGVSEAGAGSLLLYIGAATGAYAIYEQLKFKFSSRQKNGKSLPGPSSVTPFLGGLVQMVKDPYGFWEKQRQYSEKGFSWNSLFGQFIIFVTDAEKSRELMTVNDPSKMLMVLHPSAKNILGKNNMAFEHGPDHKALRKSFLSLFTRKALSVYIELQDDIIRRHMAQWLKEHEGKEFEIRNCIRDLNQMTSQEVFLGPYLDDPDTKAKFTQAYRDMTDAFLAFPLCFPGTTVWKGRCGRIYVMKVLEQCVGRARSFISSNREPRCLIDFWVRKCMEEIAEAEEEGKEPPKHTTDYKMADASTCSDNCDCFLVLLFLCVFERSTYIPIHSSSTLHSKSIRSAHSVAPIHPPFTCSTPLFIRQPRCFHRVPRVDHRPHGRPTGHPRPCQSRAVRPPRRPTRQDP